MRMNNTSSVSPEDDGIAALSLLEEAVQLLDGFDTPVEIAAHVQLAIDRLRRVLFPDAPEPDIKLDE
jgi:hypothetical protein